jgi:hypothetical protein
VGCGGTLRAGRVRLTGRAPVNGIDLGEMGPAPEQAQLRDFALPQRAIFVVGRTMFTDTAA